MPEDRLPRKLVAILYADAADYSRLTGEDEDATHRRLSEYLDLISATVKGYRGRVMHYAGDAVLAMFDAVVDAVGCAAEIQAELGRRNQALPIERKVQFRIGINLGDVIEDRGDIYGDGVNVAARLEGLAVPGGICVSDAVRSAVGRKLDVEYEDLGEQEVKNIASTVRAYRVLAFGDVVMPQGDGTEVKSNPTSTARRGRRAAMIVPVALLLAGVAWHFTREVADSPSSPMAVAIEWEALGYALALLALGVVVMVLEFFIVSFGLLTVLSVAAVGGSLYYAFIASDLVGWAFVVATPIIGVRLVRWGFRHMRNSRMMVSRGEIKAEAGYHHLTDRLGVRVGSVGVLVTAARPSGLARFEGGDCDVQLQRGTAERAARVSVLRIDGPVVYVAVLPDEEAPSGSSFSE